MTNTVKNCYDLTCEADMVKLGNVSIYAGTHERGGANFSPLHDYLQDADLWMGHNGKATIGHKDGIGKEESSGARAGKKGAFSLICLEVKGKPQAVNNEAGE